MGYLLGPTLRAPYGANKWAKYAWTRRDPSPPYRRKSGQNLPVATKQQYMMCIYELTSCESHADLGFNGYVVLYWTGRC